MKLREFGQISANTPAGFTVTLTLTVEDATRLWAAAADRALSAPGMTLADVLDTIGPREDPQLAECLAMLTAPAAIPGCGLDGFTVRETVNPLSAQLIHLPIATDGARADMLPVAFG